MKKQTYWSIHKNKKPKNVLKRKVTAKQRLQATKIARSVLIGAIGAAQLNHVPFGVSKDQRKLTVLKNLLDTSKALIGSLEYNPLENFKAIGRYGRKPKNKNNYQSLL